MQLTLCAYDAPNNIDGPTSWLKRLLPYFRKQGIETRLLFFANQDKGLSTVAHFQSLDFACRLIPGERFFEEQVLLVLEDLQQHPPDVFIPNYFPAAGYAARYAKQAGIPTVMVLHNDDAYHHALVSEFATGNASTSLSCIVAVSRLLYREVAALPSVSSSLACIPYGAPISATTSFRALDEPLKLIYLGRLNNQQKRIADVTRAFCRATREVPNVEAVIYGSGPDVDEVLAILQQEGTGKVQYKGVLQVSEVQTRLLENHVYVLLSEYEGIPIALMEAMACGLVPICSNIKSGISELVENGKNGLVVTDRTDAFVTAVKQLADDRAYWEALATAAHNTVRTGYVDEDCYAQWVKLLANLATQNSYRGMLPLPSLHTLKALQTPSAFMHGETRLPSTVMLPLQRLKKVAGRFKRNYFN